MPTVSIIIPAYNVAPYIAETLASVCAQTFTDYEVILVNDGSTDGTEEAIEPYRQHIVYLKQENRGVAAARNAGLRVARGRYVALLDGDDIWLPNYLEALTARLEADSTLDLIFPNAIHHGASPIAGKLYQDLYPTQEPITFERFVRRECFIFYGAMFRRAHLDAVGLFDEDRSVLGAEDFEMWLRMLRHGLRFSFTSEPLVMYRWRPDSLSNRGHRTLRSAVAVCEKLARDEKNTPEQRALLNERYAQQQAHLDLILFREAMRAHEYATAALHLRLANSHLHSRRLTLYRAILPFAPGLVKILEQR